MQSYLDVSLWNDMQWKFHMTMEWQVVSMLSNMKQILYLLSMYKNFYFEAIG